MHPAFGAVRRGARHKKPIAPIYHRRLPGALQCGLPEHPPGIPLHRQCGFCRSPESFRTAESRPILLGVQIKDSIGGGEKGKNQ
jgi:hypothetical protein